MQDIFNILKATVNEQKLLYNIKNFEKYLQKNLIDKHKFTSKDKQIGADAEILCAKQLQNYLQDELKINVDYEKEIKQINPGAKELEDFRYINIFFDSKVKKVKKLQDGKIIENDNDDIFNVFTVNEIIDIMDKYKFGMGAKTKKGYVENLRFFIELFREQGDDDSLMIIEEIEQIAITKKGEKGSGDAQLISYKKLTEQVILKNRPLFYIIINYNENKTIIDVFIVDYRQIDFRKLNIYLSNQFYFSNKYFKDFSTNQIFGPEQLLDKIKDRIIITRNKLIKKYKKEIEETKPLYEQYKKDIIQYLQR